MFCSSASMCASCGFDSKGVRTEFVFIGGVSVLGLFSLGAGFVSSKIPLFVLRALCGVAAAMTIPSAVTLIVHVFPEPTEQSRAIGIFGGSGAMASSEHP